MIPLVAVGGYVAKGVAMYVGEKVLTDAAQRISEGRFMQDLKSGEMLKDMVNSAKLMAGNPIDTVWEGAKSKLMLSAIEKIGVKGQVVLGVAKAVLSNDNEKVSQPTMKMR